MHFPTFFYFVAHASWISVLYLYYFTVICCYVVRWWIRVFRSSYSRCCSTKRWKSCNGTPPRTTDFTPLRRLPCMRLVFWSCSSQKHQMENNLKFGSKINKDVDKQDAFDGWWQSGQMSAGWNIFVIAPSDGFGRCFSQWSSALACANQTAGAWDTVCGLPWSLLSIELEIAFIAGFCGIRHFHCTLCTVPCAMECKIGKLVHTAH